MRSHTAIFSKLVRHFMRRIPLAVNMGTPLSDVIEGMAAEEASSATVIDGEGRPLGIVTERDITHRAAFTLGGDAPVEKIMTAPALTIPESEYLYHAIARMRRRGLRHMPVVDDAGVLTGMLNLHDALASAASRLMDQIDRVTHEGTLEGLKAVKKAQVELAEELFADDLPAVEIQALLTHINNDIYRRIIKAALGRMAAEDWGEPPVPFSAIVFGSGGRGENYLFPDQDNGFILGDYPDKDHTRIDGFFIELATRMSQDLDAVGFPFCKGHCMATNPLWRKTMSQWIDQIELWGRKRHFVAIRLADIFFDFRPVSGSDPGGPELAAVLRQTVTRMVRNNHLFLNGMYAEESERGVGLGLFNRFITERDLKEYKGYLSLKFTGLLPLVGAVRLLALREGIAETGTCARIDILYEMGLLDKDETDYLTGAFRLLTEILLIQQIKDFKAGKKVTYYVHPDTITERQKDQLTDSLKAIDHLRKRIRSDFTAEIF